MNKYHHEHPVDPNSVVSHNADTHLKRNIDSSAVRTRRYLTQLLAQITIDHFHRYRSNYALCALAVLPQLSAVSLAGDPITLGDALDNGLSWTSGGNGWYPQPYDTYDGFDAAMADVSGIGQAAWIETSINGPIAVSFWWSGNIPVGGGLGCSIDGVQQGGFAGAVGIWENQAYAVPPGSHIVRWTVYSSSFDEFSSGYGLLDQVSLVAIEPEVAILGTNGVVVPNDLGAPSLQNGTDFGHMWLTGTNSQHRFWIYNSGTTNLLVSEVSISGSHSNDFQIVSYPSVVAPRTYSNLIVRFDPEALGLRTAAVVIANNDNDESVYQVLVSGTGIENPIDDDTDDDGLPDWWEIRYFNSATNSNPTDLAAEGSHSIYEAYIADVDPTNPASLFLRPTIVSALTNGVSVVLNPTSTNRVYTLYTISDLPTDPQAWAMYPIVNTGTSSEIVFTITNDLPTLYFRSGVQLP